LTDVSLMPAGLLDPLKGPGHRGFIWRI